MSLDHRVMETDPTARLMARVADLEKQVAALQRPNVAAAQRGSSYDASEVSTTSISGEELGTLVPVTVNVPTEDSIVMVHYRVDARVTAGGAAATAITFNGTSHHAFWTFSTSYIELFPSAQAYEFNDSGGEEALRVAVSWFGFDPGDYTVSMLHTALFGAGEAFFKERRLWVAVL